MFKTKQFDYTTLNESAMKRGFACNIVCFKSNSDPYVLKWLFPCRSETGKWISGLCESANGLLDD